VTGVWKDTAPYREEPKDRWLRIPAAAKLFRINRTTLLNWCRAAMVAAKECPTSGRWTVSERSLRKHLFGGLDNDAST
jgi:hypothetical protein